MSVEGELLELTATQIILLIKPARLAAGARAAHRRGAAAGARSGPEDEDDVPLDQGSQETSSPSKAPRVAGRVLARLTWASSSAFRAESLEAQGVTPAMPPPSPRSTVRAAELDARRWAAATGTALRPAATAERPGAIAG